MSDRRTRGEKQEPTSRLITVLVFAIIVVFAAVVITSSMTGDTTTGAHTMPSGQVMNDDSMGDQMTPNGEVSSGSSKTSSDAGDVGE